MSKFYLGLRYLPYPFSSKVVGNLAFLKDFRDTQIKLFYLLLFKYVTCPLPTVSVPYCFTDLHHRLTFFFFLECWSYKLPPSNRVVCNSGSF